MSEFTTLLSDSYVQLYKSETLLFSYYTCIPTENKKQYDCVKGLYDTSYSMTDYKTEEWKTRSVPNILPRRFHNAYLSFINS